MMPPRELDFHDVHLCVPLGHAFHAEAKLPGSFVDRIFINSWQKLIIRWTGAIFGTFDDDKLVGMLGALRYKDLNDGQWVSMEAFWYVLPDSRDKGVGRPLFKAYEAWAKKHKVVRIGVAALVGLRDKELDRLYQVNGYRQLDRTYIKEAA